MNLFERAIAFLSPEWALNRASARATLSQINAFVGNAGGYEAGKDNRLTKIHGSSPVRERDIPSAQVLNLVGRSWNTWRNNPHAKKIVRSLQSKVIGKGLHPESMATTASGEPHMAFRERASQLWEEMQIGFDWRGMPGQGGLTMPDLQRMLLRAAILSGDSLYRLRAIDPSMQMQRELPIPMAMHILDSRLLAEHFDGTGVIAESHNIFRGIEFDADDQRVRYWFETKDSTSNDVVSLSVQQVRHLYVEDDIDQPRGVPWFAAALRDLQDTGDLKYNVLKASAMAACIVLGYRKATGQSRFGLAQSSDAQSNTSDGTDLTDADGNTINKIQPGMMLNLGKDGEMQGFSPNQPNTNAEAFAEFMLRGMGLSLPGIKGSSVTGNYKGASFSSEKAADNDVWPEIEAVQEWFAASACQPVFEAAVRRGVVTGYFDGIVTANEFAANANRFLKAKWQGPVAQSINPEKDILAARERIKGGVSSLQMECQKAGVKWTDVLADIAAVYKQADAMGIPPEVINNILGVDMNDVTEAVKQPEDDQGEPVAAAAEDE